MSEEYKKISIRDVKRLLMVIKFDKDHSIVDLIDEFAKDIAEILNSKILYKKTYFFPGDFEGNKDITLAGILSTSHIIISSYTEEDGIYLDIDVAWCSGKNIGKEEIKNLLDKYLKNYEIKSIRLLNYLGNEESLLS
jgi:S-adenosylmethionine/arginine decarboxylase-like enzyme